MASNKSESETDNNPMKRKILFAAICFALAGCNTQPNPGIEAGNPNVGIKTLRVVPDNANNIYEVTLVDEKNASVSELENADDPVVLHAASVPYILENNLLILKASFADSHEIALSAALERGDGSISGTLQVDGSFVSACFEIPGQTAACSPSAAPAADSAPTPAQPSSEVAPVSLTPMPTKPVKVVGEDVPKAGSTSTLADKWANLIQGSPEASETSGQYCVLINGLPACKIPAVIDTKIPLPVEIRVPISEVSRSLDLSGD